MYVAQSYEKNVEPQPVYFKKVASETVFRFCEDILNALRGYPQRPARISSTPCEDILNSPRGYPRFYRLLWFLACGALFFVLR